MPAGAVLTVPEVLAHPQIAERGMLGRFTQVPGVGRDISVVRTGIKLDGKAPQVDTPPPRLGQHNQDVYGALGLSVADIERLAEDGVI